MKIASTIARYLLGLMFVIFGSNMFFHFIPLPMPTGLAGQFMGALFASHFVYFLGSVMVISGILLLINRYVPLALVFLGPVLVNILLYHALMHPEGAIPGIVATLFWVLVYWQVRSAFRPLFQPRAAD